MVIIFFILITFSLDQVLILWINCACNHLSSGNKHKMKTTRWRIGEFIKTNNEGVIFLSFLFLG